MRALNARGHGTSKGCLRYAERDTTDYRGIPKALPDASAMPSGQMPVLRVPVKTARQDWASEQSALGIRLELLLDALSKRESIAMVQPKTFSAVVCNDDASEAYTISIDASEPYSACRTKSMGGSRDNDNCPFSLNFRALPPSQRY